MGKISDLTALRLDMDMLQAKIKNLHNRGFTPGNIAHTLDISEKSTRIIIAYLGGRFNGS